VLAVDGGFVPSLYSFACFCAAASFGLERWSVPVAFVVALGVSLLAQTLVLAVVRRERRGACDRPAAVREAIS
jgi:membrane protein implicated in regulation of membrane protease activity